MQITFCGLYFPATFSDINLIVDKSRSDFSGQTIDLTTEELFVAIRREKIDKNMRNVHFQVELGFFLKNLKASLGNVIIEIDTSDKTILTVTVNSWRDARTCKNVVKLYDTPFPNDEIVRITLISDLSGELRIISDGIEGEMVCRAMLTKKSDKVSVQWTDLAPDIEGGQSGAGDFFTVEYGIRRKPIGKF